MQIGSVSFRVCMYLCARPNAELLAKDIARLYGISSPKQVRTALAPALRVGWLQNATGKCGRGNVIRYAPGPRMLRELGQLE